MNNFMQSLQDRLPSRWSWLSYGMLPSVIMLLVFIVCIIAYGLTNANLEESRERYIDRRLNENTLRLDAAFNSYAYLLWASTGRLESGTYSEASWERFVSIFNIPKNFSSTEAIALALNDDHGNIVIKYITPSNEITQSAVGEKVNNFADVESTLKESRDIGDIAIAGPFTDPFSQANTAPKKDFMIVSPFYNPLKSQSTTKERAGALRGYTLAMFHSDTFFYNVFKGSPRSHMTLRVYLNSDNTDNLIYKVGNLTTGNLRTVSQEFTKFGKTFTVEYAFDADYILGFSQNYLPQFIVISGLIIGMLIAGVAAYMLRTRYGRLTLEKEQAVAFAKDELLSLASHQLRTPATGVKQYLGMILQGFTGDVSEQQRIYLERAYSVNNRQLQIINDILHMAKLEAGRIVLAEHELDITKMVRDVVDDYRNEAQNGDVTLECQVPSKGLMIGDSHMLRMVLENLVSNAVKYTEAGGRVDVRLIRKGDQWVFSVKDTGVGVAKADFPKLFKQFSRINNSLSYFVTGTGVGLYLAHHLTVLHGGRIHVSSKRGKGSTFTVVLPRKM